ncbi:unnamed protein product [Heligmosomoides polygyrus]|uniref:CCHC-type domain-containing protein n=1 Tax=Heligmosomoides polygyrus TaxID=6339 RepID=A0A183F2P4_HELPZ|nr:unnamed protein product [Heligmosomoides polygyrus]
MLNKLENLQQTVRESKEFIQDLALRIESLNQRRAEGVAETHNENAIINENWDYMESLGEDAKDEDQPVPDLVEDGDDAEDGDDVEGADDEVNPAEMVDDEADAIADDEMEGVAENEREMQHDQEGDDPAPDEVRQDADDHDDDVAAVQRIEHEIRVTEQALHDFEEIIRQLRQEPTCPPRKFDFGRISRSNEMFMKCAFCGVTGSHYSDSCTTVRYAEARRQVIADSHKCDRCLEFVCSRGQTCKKFYQKCFHCRQIGHHSALCDFPERSDLIRAHLENANNSRLRCLNRLQSLNRDLRLHLGHH